MTDRNAHDEPLSIENGTDLLIALLYAPGKSGQSVEPIDGITRLQKLMFLLQQREGPASLVKEAKEYFDYKPFKMGPFSIELQRDLDELKAAGIIETERLRYFLADDADDRGTFDPDFDVPRQSSAEIESERFRLSEEPGREIGRELFESLIEEEGEALSEFKSFFNALSLRQLLIYTYERHPEYTGESTIKKQLGMT